MKYPYLVLKHKTLHLYLKNDSEFTDGITYLSEHISEAYKFDSIPKNLQMLYPVLVVAGA